MKTTHTLTFTWNDSYGSDYECHATVVITSGEGAIVAEVDVVGAEPKTQPMLLIEERAIALAWRERAEMLTKAIDRAYRETIDDREEGT